MTREDVFIPFGILFQIIDPFTAVLRPQQWQQQLAQGSTAMSRTITERGTNKNSIISSSLFKSNQVVINSRELTYEGQDDKESSLVHRIGIGQTM